MNENEMFEKLTDFFQETEKNEEVVKEVHMSNELLQLFKKVDKGYEKTKKTIWGADIKIIPDSNKVIIVGEKTTKEYVINTED